ncbi:MAG: hypothetical protein V4727_01435 [Verrucomicrobiota bacterium]
MRSAVHVVTLNPNALKEYYVIAKLVTQWREWGHSITVGPAQNLSVGLGIMHIDRTKVIPELVPETQLPLLNGRVLDTSKNLFSTLRVYPDDTWAGQVIIKSTLNCFGTPERNSYRPGFFERRRRELAESSWRLARMLPEKEYPVLKDISAVPGWVWKRDDLIVERFMPEREGDLYSIRGWLFFGDRGYTYRLFSKSPVVKVATTIHYEILDHVPPELELLRKTHGYDFGKFDYVEVDGRPVVIDMNKTPTTIAKPDSPRMLDLAQGIYGFPGMRGS